MTEGAALSGQGVRHINLALSGSGLRFIYQLGAVQGLLDRGYVIDNVAGTSGGALVALGIACGISPREMMDELMKVDFTTLRDNPSWLVRMPIVSKVVADGLHVRFPSYDQDSLKSALGVFTNGAYDGKVLENEIGRIIYELTLKKYGIGVRTFDDFYKLRAQGVGCNLAIIAHDSEQNLPVVFPRDYEKVYHLDSRQQTVASAASASTRIPVFYKPMEITDPKSNQTYELEDGGVSVPYPFELAQSMDRNLPTLGVLIKDQGKMPILPKWGPFASPARLASDAAGRSDAYVKLLMSTEPAKSNTIVGFNLPVGPTDFAASKLKFYQLFEMGYRRAWRKVDQQIGRQLRPQSDQIVA